MRRPLWSNFLEGMSITSGGGLGAGTRRRRAAQAQKMGDRGPELVPRDDRIDEPVLEHELGGLEPLRELLLDRLLDDAAAGEADQCAGLGQDKVGLEGEARRGDAIDAY